jgi:hypothetical protein
MSPLFAQCAEEVAHKRNITINHRTSQGHCADGICEELFAGSKSHLAVVYAWLVGKKKRGARHDRNLFYLLAHQLYTIQLAILVRSRVEQVL